MAIFHLSVKTISRSTGRSATAAIAYRAGERLIDDRTGLVFDYTRRRGVEHTEIFLPENTPAWASNRERLWNAAELAETRKNSTVAREFEIAIPAELNREQRVELVREFARDLVQRHGMAVDVAIHEPGKDGDHRNHHAHILCSTRRLTSDGFKEKTRELDDQKSGEVANWRQRWADVSNRHLENAGRQERIDHRSLSAQRADAIERGDKYQAAKLDRLPTIHLGPNVLKMEQRGIRTERGEQGREIVQWNAKIINLAEARERIDAARVAYERDNGNGRDRTTNGDDERTAARAIVEKPGRHSDKSNIGRPEQVPPPFARGRLRNLSELGVVRFAERSEMLLPRDVLSNVEHQPAEPNHELRRGNDGLTQEVANDTSTEAIRREWQNETTRQFTLIVNRAKELHARTADVMERQEGKLAIHDQARPVEPTGLFANLKKTTHEQALVAWRGVRIGLEKRWTQLRNRLHLIGDYMRKAGPHEQPSRGERLAEKKAAQARPELAASYHQVIENRRATRIAMQRAKIEQHQQSEHKERDMKDENSGEPRFDPEQKYEISQGIKLQADALAKELNAGTEKGDLVKEARRREVLERFKAKAARDRSDKDRGR